MSMATILLSIENNLVNDWPLKIKLLLDIMKYVIWIHDIKYLYLKATENKS